MRGAVQCGVLLLGFVLLAAAATPAQAAQQADAVPPAAKIVADLRHGVSDLRSDVVVPDRLVLSGIDTISAPFRCRGCRFEKGIDASGVTFERTVDLAGARIGEDASFRGTTFRGPAVFGAETCSAGFAGGADFSLAVFDDLASFDGTSFARAATFDDAQFRGDADFGSACFFRQTLFRQASFAGRASFTQTRFIRGGIFDGTSFARGASFLAATFSAPRAQPPAASFQDASSGGDLDFTFAQFAIVTKKKKHVPPAVRRETDQAAFSYLVCTGSASFRDADFAPDYGIAMDHVHIGDLVLDVAAARQVDEDPGQDANQRTVLDLIESSANDRGDLKVANDAHYRAEILVSNHYHQPWRALDYVFYRGVAGYLVRPLRPILVLLALVLLLALVRVAVAGPSVEAHGRHRTGLGSRLRGAGTRSRNILVDVFDTIALVGPRGSRAAGELSVGRRFEIFVYRLLVVCALLALANANPTLRQMVDSLF
jgi:Pentapeptide repeats (9 copies)